MQFVGGELHPRGRSNQAMFTPAKTLEMREEPLNFGVDRLKSLVGVFTGDVRFQTRLKFLQVGQYLLGLPVERLFLLGLQILDDGLLQLIDNLDETAYSIAHRRLGFGIESSMGIGCVVRPD